MEKINKIKVKGIDHEITLTEEEGKNVVDKQLLTKAGDAVPNSGLVENLYFNTELIHEEILEIIKQLDFVPFSSDAFGYIIAATIDGISLLGIMVDNVESPNVLAIGDMGANSVVLYDYEGIYSGGAVNGWNTLIPNPIPVNVEVVSTFDGVSAGQQNDLITRLIATSPIVETDKYTTKSKAEEISNKITKSYLFNKPTTVPVDGVTNVEKVYFNTSLSEKEVVNILKKLTLNLFGYYVFLSEDKQTSINILWGGAGIYGISASNNKKSEVIFASGSDVYGFTGWNPDVANSFVLNEVSVLENTDDSGTYSIGNQNDLLKNIFSTTSFEKYVSKDYLDEYMKNNFENGNEGSY